MHNPDILDDPAELEQQIIEIALANRPKPTMTYTGLCHNGDCGEKIAKGFFCCPERRENFEHIERALRNQKVA